VAKADKLLARMRNNPRDWSIADLKTLAARHGLDWRQPGTSHVTFSHATGVHLTVPSHKPIKPVYVERFVALLDRIGASDGD
jgi:predicted RNA binding protein YcfA (HicA-like mRNA interferase family)